MKQALQIAIDYMNDRLEDHDCKYQRHPATEAERINILADIETVKEALAQSLCDVKQEQSVSVGEPVGTVDKDEFGLLGVVDSSKVQVGDLLYTAPYVPTGRQQRTAAEGEDTRRAWVGLTDDEKRLIEVKHGLMYFEAVFFDIEAKLKEKNNVSQ